MRFPASVRACVFLVGAWLGVAPVAAQSPPPPAQPSPPRPPTSTTSRPATAAPNAQPPAAANNTPRAAANNAPRAAAQRPPVVAPPRQPNAHRPTKPATPPARPAPPPPEPAPPPQEPAVEPGKGSVTGLPIPRFAALRSDEVNLRSGPGQRYPVEWVYKRRDLPVQIEREFDVWRLVRDPEGVKGWVHQATLTGRRSFVVTGEERAIRRSASEDASVVARLKPGVVGVLRKCEPAASWCQVQVGEYRGWLKRSDFWGSLANEAVN